MIRTIYCFAAAALWLAFLFPFAALSILLTFSGDTSIWMARKLWSPVLLWVGGVKLLVHGRDHIDTSKPAIYVSNHQSTIDIPVLFMAIPVNLRFVGKKELGYVPILGWYLVLAGYILIDRGNHRKAIASLEKAAQKIRKGTNIIVYPEGTRSPDGTVMPFKKGPFALAIKSGVPIIPVTIEGSGRVMPKNSWNAKPGTIEVMLGKPIDTTGYAENERERLMKDVRDVIIEQSLKMGGKGGDKGDAVAARGLEGIGRPKNSGDGDDELPAT
jgi:1-acyl-sn-glycerol-3-phosphate acyltransferase